MNCLTMLKKLFSQRRFFCGPLPSAPYLQKNIPARILAGPFRLPGQLVLLARQPFGGVYSLFSAIRRIALATPAFTFVSVI